MRAYPDTSFLFAFYVKQSNSATAAAYARTMREPLHITTLLAYEFRQALRFQTWRRASNPNLGLAAAHMHIALQRFQGDLLSGVAMLVPCDFQDVFDRADQLSTRYTVAHGNRSLDILHVATALHLSARDFLTFDANQRALASTQKLRLKP